MARRTMNWMVGLALLAISGLFMTACPSSPKEQEDAGPDAAPTPDAAEPDAAEPDAGQVDAMAEDAGPSQDGGPVQGPVTLQEWDFGPNGMGGGAFSNPKVVYPALFSPDGQKLVLLARSEPADRAAGRPVALRIATLGSQVTKDDLLLSRVPEQIAFTPDGSGLLVLSEGGTHLDMVDLAALSATSIWQAHPGGSTHKLYSVLWQDGTSVYGLARVFDAQGLMTHQYQVVRIDTAQGRLEDVWSYDQAFADHGPVRSFRPAGADKVVFVGQGTDGQEHLFVASSTGQVQEVDQAPAFGDYATSDEGDILYTKRDASGNRELDFYDAQAGQTTQIAQGDYTYTFLAHDGSVGLVTLIDTQATGFGIFVWTPQDGLQPADPSLQDVPFGPMKLAADGSRFLYFGPGRIVLGTFTR